jgi:hypothetical protein
VEWSPDLGLHENLGGSIPYEYRHLHVGMPLPTKAKLVDDNERKILLQLSHPQTRDSTIFELILKVCRDLIRAFQEDNKETSSPELYDKQPKTQVDTNRPRAGQAKCLSERVSRLPARENRPNSEHSWPICRMPMVRA